MANASAPKRKSFEFPAIIIAMDIQAGGRVSMTIEVSTDQADKILAMKESPIFGPEDFK